MAWYDDLAKVAGAVAGGPMGTQLIAANEVRKGNEGAFGSWGGAAKDWLMGTPDKKADPAIANLQDRAYIQQQVERGIAGAQGRLAPQANATYGAAARIDPAQQAQWRQREMALADQMQSVLSGQQRGAGELAVNRQVQQALAANQAQARMARGANAGIAALAGARGAANIGQSGIGQAAQSAMGDQQAARAIYGQILGQGRGADIGMATSQANLAQQMGLANMDAANNTSQFNAQAQRSQSQMNDNAINSYLQQLLDMSQSEQAGRLAIDAEARKGKAGHLGDVLQAGGAIAGGMAGGPGGAKAGAAAGKPIGDGLMA